MFTDVLQIAACHCGTFIAGLSGRGARRTELKESAVKLGIMRNASEIPSKPSEAHTPLYSVEGRDRVAGTAPGCYCFWQLILHDESFFD